MAHAVLWISLLTCATLVNFATAQKCVQAVKGLSVTEQAYRTPIIVKVKVVKPGKENHTAQVTEVFETRNGGLAKKSNIVFGPAKKGKGCPRIKKNGQYVVFLELPDPSDPNYHRLQFDPAKASQAKKLKKFLCKGCVKPPKISGKSKKVNVKENSKYTFKCKASGNPKPLATFLKDGEPLPKKTNGMKIKIKKKGGGGKLMLTKVKKEHEGVYTCQVNSFVGNASLSITLTVLKGETPTTPPTTTETDDCDPCPASDADFCVNGRCCFVIPLNQSACRCDRSYQGTRCDQKRLFPLPGHQPDINIVEARYQQQTIAIMGVCIALLLTILICYIVYCKFKKSRSQVRKELIARNGHVAGRQSEPERTITDASPAGVLADDGGDAGVRMTGYHSTDFNVGSVNQQTAFSQRPQTYDDVILTQQAAEAQPLVQSAEPARYTRPQNGSRHHQEGNGRRRRKNGVAVGHTDDHSRSGSDVGTPKAPRRVDEIKSSAHDSLTSSASSLASHDLRRPVLPIDDRVAMMALREVQPPPAYPMKHRDDEPDSSARQPSTSRQTSPESLHHPTQGSTSSPHSPMMQDHAPSPSSPSSSSSHRVTTFDSDGRVEEETMGRDEGTLQDVTTHSPNMSPDFYHQYLPKADQNPPSSPLAFTGSDGSRSPQRPKLQYQNKNIGGMYPYHEHNPDHPRSPASRHDSYDFFSGIDKPDALQMYDSHVHSQPQSEADVGMEVPYRHAPVTVASARTHQLALLTKEQHELPPVNAEAKLLAGSTLSLSSTLSNRSSLETERNRNSHKIEV